MRREAVFKAAYYACLATDEKPSVRNVATMVLKITGTRPWGEHVRAWLSVFLGTASSPQETPQNRGSDTFPIQSRYGSDTVVVLKSEQNDTPPIRKLSPRVRVAKVLSIKRLGSSMATPSQNASVAADKKPKAPRQQGLPLDAEVESRKREILNAVWPLVQANYGRSFTKNEWTKINSRTARSLAELQRTPDELVAAWHRATERIGSPVKMLTIVRDELARDEVAADELNSSDRLPTLADLLEAGKVSSW